MSDQVDEDEVIYAIMTSCFYVRLRSPRPLTPRIGEPDDAYPKLSERINRLEARDAPE